MSPLLELTVRLNDVDRKFFIRSESDGDRGVIQQIFSNQDYNLGHFPQNRSVISYYKNLTRLGKTPLIIDAGANIGASVVYFCAIYPHSRVIAIEPEPNNCQMLTRNCEGLGYSLLEGGIGSKNGTLFLNDPGHSDWGFRLKETGDYQVKVFSADELVRKCIGQALHPFIFKIDIEGGEHDLFRSSTSWLSEFPVLIIELHDWLFPGESNSKNFLRAISSGDFDFVYRGENVFCFNNNLLREF
jgi:FkbM family methyltransferase